MELAEECCGCAETLFRKLQDLDGIGRTLRVRGDLVRAHCNDTEMLRVSVVYYLLAKVLFEQAQSRNELMLTCSSLHNCYIRMGEAEKANQIKREMKPLLSKPSHLLAESVQIKSAREKRKRKN